MSKNKKLWDVIWKIVKFILTIGISHISKREENCNVETLNDTNNE